MLMRLSCYLIDDARHISKVKSVFVKRSKSQRIIKRELTLSQSTRENNPIACRTKNSLSKVGSFFNISYLLHKLGFKASKQIKFRKKLRKLPYPWHIFSLGAGITMLLGDFISQICMEKGEKEKYNIMRALHYAAIGVFIAAPLSHKWTLFWLRRLPRHNRAGYVAKSILLDVVLLTPLLVLTTMVVFDYKVAHEKYKDARKLFRTRYRKPLEEIMLFYIQTRPIVAIVSCYILKKPLNKIARTLYYTVFYTFMANTFYKHKLGHYKATEVGKSKTQMQEGCNCIKKWFSNLFSSSNKPTKKR